MKRKKGIKGKRIGEYRSRKEGQRKKHRNRSDDGERQRYLEKLKNYSRGSNNYKIRNLENGEIYWVNLRDHAEVQEVSKDMVMERSSNDRKVQ